MISKVLLCVIIIAFGFFCKANATKNQTYSEACIMGIYNNGPSLQADLDKFQTGNFSNLTAFKKAFASICKPCHEMKKCNSFFKLFPLNDTEISNTTVLGLGSFWDDLFKVADWVGDVVEAVATDGDDIEADIGVVEGLWDGIKDIVHYAEKGGEESNEEESHNKEEESHNEEESHHEEEQAHHEEEQNHHEEEQSHHEEEQTFDDNFLDADPRDNIMDLFVDFFLN